MSKDVNIFQQIMERSKEKFNGTIIVQENEQINKHWNHKPYKCDFGGAKDETLR